MKRVEHTLQEICSKLEEKGKAPHIEGNENFANLLEDVIPSLSKATSESRRARFRDLLFNAIQTPADDPAWDYVNMVAKKIDNINNLGMQVIAGIHRCQTRINNLCAIFPEEHDPGPPFYLARQNPPLKFSLSEPHAPDSPRIALQSDLWETYLVLKGLKHEDVIEFTYKIHDIGFSEVRLTGLGELLVRWAMSDQFTEDAS